ncbi:MAG: heme-copper oxidase subunit III [Planctomycetes bacterium]|nr:heme-copper oxidase subunit III [Planctomycetota bacterium]
MNHASDSLAHHEGNLDPVKAGMITFLASESAFFGTLIMVYLFNLGTAFEPEREPYTPGKMLDLPLALPGTICLLLSSVTVHYAAKMLAQKKDAAFRLLWLATITLGIVFLGGTAVEWRDMIHAGFNISTNLFGSSYFTLVGFHAAHVTVGIILLTLVLALSRRTRAIHRHEVFAEVVSWYWHFVDGVWVVVFSVVYVFGR